MVSTPPTKKTAVAQLVTELRAANTLLGKLVELDDGRRVIELRCRGKACPRLCYFDPQTGAVVDLDHRSE